MAKVDILNILFAYNEIKLLPFKKKFCDVNGMTLYVIDNMSNDGTGEWLKKNGIASHKVNTHNSFDLRILHKELQRTIHRIKPRWVVYNGADLFPVMDDKICNIIHRVEQKGYNAITLMFRSLFNTGEVSEKYDPFNTYFYTSTGGHLTMIVKYDRSLRVNVDQLVILKMKKVRLPGIILNYGHTKSPKEREETYRRRRLAWSRGLHKAYGRHYIGGHRRGWIYTKERLKDIRTTEYYKYVQQLQQWIK